VLPFARPGEALVAVVAMGLLVLICRWVFSPTHTPPRASDGEPVDYGLLVPVTVAATAADAAMLRDLLAAQGIRASVSARHEVLVFERDLERARALVG